MNEPLITECPGCHARFRVTPGQLNLAQGQVRCGACLLVFDARSEADSLERKRREHSPARPPVRQAQATTSAPTKSPAPPSEPNVVAQQGSQQGVSGPAPVKDTEPEIQASAAPETEEVTQSARERQHSTPDPRAIEPSVVESEVPNIEEDLIPKLYAEPILLEVSREQNDPYAATGWALASILALLVLAGQYLWFERATLAHTPDLHPIYALACDTIPCALGPQAYGSIVNQRMVVRPHPAFADALSIDIELRNDAAFAQPYPALDLTFTDLKGRLVAHRVFQPREYLASGSAGELMQPMTPVHVQLEITDPGVRAISYELNLRPAG
ncbi:putative transmembrane protein [Marinobacterium lacunae]|uniref:Putative transmembrane protein n=1 Tax=Marinobacterium lacunae TaxID=1232683 RepID=A0A081G438_9GAMM|nr:zinc-ribbon and DUF3426 domain-containing protein [Marinobacterium lacunae]KEA65543.1 putative transmembrane protein [Marinobacterium lacunae]